MLRHFAPVAMMMEIKEEEPENAEASIVVTESGTETKENLAIARRELKKQEQQQKKEQQQKDKKDQNKEQQNQQDQTAHQRSNGRPGLLCSSHHQRLIH